MTSLRYTKYDSMVSAQQTAQIKVNMVAGLLTQYSLKG